MGRRTLWTAAVLAASAAVAAACVLQAAAEPEAKKFTKDVVLHVEWNYVQWLPEGYAASEKKWPLLVFLHGAGEVGDRIATVERHGPPKLAAAGRKFPFILVAPQSPHLLWNPLEVNAFTEEMVKTLKVDATRVWITGLSMGGNATWMAAAIRPDLYAAAVPVCGWGDFFMVRGLARMGVWAFHGAKDPIVPVAKTQELVDSLKLVGGKPKLTIYPEAQHDSWTQAYDDPELWKWLEAQKREE
jgi:predicted peptidase